MTIGSLTLLANTIRDGGQHHFVWATRFFVNGTKATLPYSNDNFLYALPAEDAERHESLTVPGAGEVRQISMLRNQSQ